MKEWTFIANHGLVLLYLSRKEQCTAREIASQLGVTERTIHRVIQDLESEGYISRTRTGRANIYKINRDIALKNTLTRNSGVKDLLNLIGPDEKIPVKPSRQPEILKQVT